MTAHTAFTPAATSDLHVRLMASAILNGQFDGVPLRLYSKVDWIDAAQALADVTGEPVDEAQAVAEFDLMLVKSDYLDRWYRLPEREQGADFETWFDRQPFADVRWWKQGEAA